MKIYGRSIPGDRTGVARWSDPADLTRCPVPRVRWPPGGRPLPALPHKPLRPLLEGKTYFLYFVGPLYSRIIHVFTRLHVSFVSVFGEYTVFNATYSRIIRAFTEPNLRTLGHYDTEPSKRMRRRRQITSGYLRDLRDLRTGKPKSIFL